MGLPVFGLVIAGPSWVFGGCLAIAALLGVGETLALLDARGKRFIRNTEGGTRPVWDVGAFTAALALFGTVVWPVSAAIPWTLVLLGSLALWGSLAARREAGWKPGSRSPRRRRRFLLAALVYVALPLALVARLHAEAGAAWIVLLLVVTWLGDAGAYFGGRALGRRPLAPAVSPNKTCEGALAGLATAVALALGVRAWLLPDLPVAACLALAASANVLGQAGDLIESSLKRAAGCKDSGVLFPGYGGLLDKIDSLLLAGPWLYACSHWLAA